MISAACHPTQLNITRSVKMQLKRVIVRPARKGVKVMGFAYAARGGEQLIGVVECDLKDLKVALGRDEIKRKIGLDLAPPSRIPTDLENIA